MSSLVMSHIAHGRGQHSKRESACEQARSSSLCWYLVRTAVCLVVAAVHLTSRQEQEVGRKKVGRAALRFPSVIPLTKSFLSGARIRNARAFVFVLTLCGFGKKVGHAASK